MFELFRRARHWLDRIIVGGDIPTVGAALSGQRAIHELRHMTVARTLFWICHNVSPIVERPKDFNNAVRFGAKCALYVPSAIVFLVKAKPKDRFWLKL